MRVSAAVARGSAVAKLGSRARVQLRHTALLLQNLQKPEQSQCILIARYHWAGRCCFAPSPLLLCDRDISQVPKPGEPQAGSSSGGCGEGGVGGGGNSVLFWFHSVSLGTWGDGSDGLSSGLHMSKAAPLWWTKWLRGISTAGGGLGKQVQPLTPGITSFSPAPITPLPALGPRHLAFNSFCVNTVTSVSQARDANQWLLTTALRLFCRVQTATNKGSVGIRKLQVFLHAWDQEPGRRRHHEEEGT